MVLLIPVRYIPPWFSFYYQDRIDLLHLGKLLGMNLITLDEVCECLLPTIVCQSWMSLDLDQYVGSVYWPCWVSVASVTEFIPGYLYENETNPWINQANLSLDSDLVWCFGYDFDHSSLCFILLCDSSVMEVNIVYQHNKNVLQSR